MHILAIDPGTTKSAWVIFDGERLLTHGIDENPTLLEMLRRAMAQHLAVEMIASYGMPVGREIFATCVWIGHFLEAAGMPHTLVYRRDVKMHLCGSARAKDSNVTQALRDIWAERCGIPERELKGRKAAPGPLYGVRRDIWQALAVAEYWWDCKRKTEETSDD